MPFFSPRKSMFCVGLKPLRSISSSPPGPRSPYRAERTHCGWDLLQQAQLSLRLCPHLGATHSPPPALQHEDAILQVKGWATLTHIRAAQLSCHRASATEEKKLRVRIWGDA